MPRPYVATATTTGTNPVNSNPIQLDYFPQTFSVSAQITQDVAGATSKVQISIDGTNWYDVGGSLTGVTTTALGAINVPCQWVRLQITAGASGTARLTVLQFGVL